MYRPMAWLFLSALLLVVNAPVAWAQVHDWSKRFGDTLVDRCDAVAIDASGNVIVTGSFTGGTVDFGGGPLVSAGSTDIFVANFNANGVHQWSRRFGAAGDDVGDGVAVDATGSTIVTGWFSGTVDFGGGPLVSTYAYDMFVAKFDVSGAHQWSRSFGSAEDQWGRAVAVDASGNVVVAGYFRTTLDFGGGLLTSAGGDDIFLAKFDASGVHQWSQRFGAASTDNSHGVAVDASGNVLVTGRFSGNVDFGGGPLTSAGSVDVFVAKYNGNGVHQWSRRFGGAGSDRGAAVAVDASGKAIVTGFFQSNVDFGGGSLASAGGDDIFVAKYDASGVHQWSQRFGDTGSDGAGEVAMDASGNAILTGFFRGSVDFGGGSLVSAGGDEIFVAKYNESGVHQWSRGFGSTGGDRGLAVAADVSGDLVATGVFQGTVDLGGGALVSAGSLDMFIARFTNCTVIVPVEFTFNPQTLNLSSQGQWVTGYLEPPAGYAANDINVSSLLINRVVPVAPGAPTSIGDFDGDMIPDLTVKFNRSDLTAILEVGDDILLSVSGDIAGDCLAGSDMITVRGRKMDSPVAGTVLVPGTTADVHWEVEQRYGNVDLLSSLDGGATWNIEARSLPNTGSHVWTVPDASTDHALLSAVVVGALGQSDMVLEAEFGTSEVFTIASPTDAGNRTHDLSLRGIAPNPSHNGFSVTFSLPNSRPAQLEVYDVRGRQVASSPVGYLGPGMHRVNFGKERNFAAGVYLVRLTQSGRTFTAQATVVQ